MVDGPVRPLPQEVVLPRGPAGAPARGNGSGTSPPVEDMGFPLGLTPPSAVGSSNTSAYRGARREPIGPLPTTGGAPGPGPGCAAHGGPQAHRHPAPGQQAREVRQEAGFSGSTSPRGSGPVPTPWAPLSRAPSFRGRSGRRRPQPTPGRCLALSTVRKARGPTVGSNRRPGCRVEAVPPRSAPPVWTRTLWALRSVLRLPPTPVEAPPRDPAEQATSVGTTEGLMETDPEPPQGPHLRIPLGACPPGRAPWK